MPGTEANTLLSILPFPGGCSSARVRPLISADAKPHFDGLTQGLLLLQRCTSCQHWQFPPGPVCTRCGCAGADWAAASGNGRIHSWVRYQRSFLTEFETLIPYVVLAVHLDEGPVVFGRLVQTDVVPTIGQPVRAVVEKWIDDFCGLAFRVQKERT